LVKVVSELKASSKSAKTFCFFFFLEHAGELRIFVLRRNE